MESENESNASIDSTTTQYINLALKGETEIVKNICNLITNQISLELKYINQNINERLKSTYEEILIQLKIDLRKMEKLKLEKLGESDQLTILEGKIQEHINKIVKLKEINIYFGHLSKQSSSLEKDVEKFLFYQPKSDNLQEKLEVFFSSPLVSELFLKQYQKSFNMNNFSADLIEFFHFLQENGLLEAPQPEIYQPIRNKDLMLIENTNIIFRQICDINDKYAHVEHQMQDSYVHLKFIKSQEVEQDYDKNKFKIEEGIIQQKFANLKTIFNKIKSIYGGIQFNNFENRLQTVILPEEPEIFEMLNQSFEYRFATRNEQFLTFLQDLYDPTATAGIEDPGQVPHFDFLRKKIIKAQTRWHLNRLISAFNVGSHIVNQLQSNLNLTHHSYSFNNPWIISKYEFNSSRVDFFTSKLSHLSELFILNKNTIIVKKDDSYLLCAAKDKVIYPSAINNYFYFLKYLYALSSILQQKKIYSQELMLELVEIKADEMMEWAEIAINLYEIIKSKYFRCYQVLQKYLALIFQVYYQQQLDYIQKNLKEGAQGISFILEKFISKQKKAGCISQIIFEFQADYDIRESLLKLYSIEKMHRCTFYCTDTPFFYETVLNEIIQTKNNLKFDRCLSFNTLHQMFGFLAARPNDLKDLAEQLTPLSKTYMRLPDLLRFYATQTKLKRQVFKAELYWITIAQNSVKNKFIINSQRKKVNFRDFLQENAKNILCLTDKPLSYFLTNLQEFERSVSLFSQQVERLKLIQSSLLYLKPDFALQDHISAFSHKELVTFFNYCSHFNLIEDLFLRRDKKNWILSNIKKFIANGKLKFSDLSLQSSIVAMKQQLSNYIFFIFSFEHHYTYDDCIKLIKRVVKGSQPPEYALKLEILRSKRDLLKEYQQSQFMDCPSLSELTQIYQLLVLIGVNRLLRTRELDKEDVFLFEKIRKDLPLYVCFKAIDFLDTLESIKAYSCTTSKVHTLCGLKNIFSFYKQMKQKNKKYHGEWSAIENLGLMTEIGIVSRRLFCNEIVELKRIVSADEWRTFNKTTCLNNLKQELDKEFISYVNAFISNNIQGCELDLSCNLAENMQLIQDLFKKQIFIQYNERYSLEVIKKDPIILFDQFRGYEIEYISKEEKQTPHPKQYYKKHRTNFKRGLLNTLKREDHGSTQIINDLQHRINLEIVKESLPIRKLIYQLQLQQKRIRDEISWQTCKLEHNVITKINKFIEESNLDQKQSLINFKYTVNLETIKGIENVIHERTQIFDKNNQLKLNQTEHVEFITEPRHQSPKDQATQEETLLDLNVRNIFNHVKMLKIFWAWKNIYLKKQNNEDEWVKFSENVEKILHNKDNLKKMENLQQLRENCNKHEIVCNLIKEENVLLNNSIKKIKVNTLTKKLNNFKDKYKVQVESNQV